MEPAVIIALIAAVPGTAGIVWTIVSAARSSRQKRLDEAAARALAEEAAERVETKEERDAKAEMGRQIDARLAEILEENTKEIKGLREQVRELFGEVQNLKRSEGRLKGIVRRWFNALQIWDSRGHHGAMPIPSPQDLVTLELDTELYNFEETVPSVPPIPKENE